MKTTLRIINKEGESRYEEIPNPFNMIPYKGDSIVWRETPYVVRGIEYDYDDNVV